MIANCLANGSAPSLARDLLAGADCLISGQVAQGYAALLAPGGTLSQALTVAPTIYVAIIGYRLILGQAGLTLGELVPHFVKIGVVLALATSWPSYQALVFDLLFHGPEQLAAPILHQVGGAGGGDVLGALQDVFDRLTDYAGDAWAQHAPQVASATQPALPQVTGATTPAPAALPFALGAPQFVAALLWISALVLLAASVGVLLVVRIVLALLLVLGPVFVACALFAGTRGLFEGWLRMAVRFALVPLFVLPLTAAVVAVLAPFVAELDGPVTGVRDGPVLVIALIVLVFAAVMLQAARLGAGIAGGIRLPRRRPVAAPAVGAKGADARPVTPMPAASRAEVLVQALRSTAAGRTIVLARDADGAVPATRRITVGAVAATAAADSSARLGQGYRRLAIGAPAAPARGMRS